MNKRAMSLAVIGLLAACNSESVTVQKVDPGSECAAGGVKLFVPGKDPELVCNGATGPKGNPGADGTTGGDGTSGFTSLFTQVALPVGDARCPRGGVALSSGIDSGGDGGTANDGTLQPQEVTATSVLCNGDDHLRVGSMVAPAGAPGTATIKVNGGEGTAGQGGTAGSVRLGMQQGTNGGHVKTWKTGKADATFTIPTVPAPDLGPTPLAITTDTTLELASNPASVDAGVPYFTTNGLFISQGPTQAPKPVTGLTVAAGVTLTVPLFPFSVTTAQRSCRIDGTVRGVAPTGSGNVLSLDCGDLVLSSTSRIEAAGTPQNPTKHVALYSRVGSLLALGLIDASGLDAAPNQPSTSGSSIDLWAEAAVITSGTLRSNGGGGVDATIPAAGGNIHLTGRTAVWNQATIEALGSTSTSAAQTAGGDGGSVRLTVNDGGGQLRNHGAITVNGGASKRTGCTACTGGRGGQINFETLHGGLITDATINALGGEGQARGGDGGFLTFIIASYSGGIGVFGSALVSGSIDASAGAGALGGRGGEVSVFIGYGADFGAEVVALGYAAIEANGGAGSLDTSGGSGGFMSFFQSRGPLDVSGGAVLNTVALHAHGGDGTGSAVGGTGGHVSLQTQLDVEWPAATFEVVDNAGTIDVRGGQGAQGGTGGQVDLRGRVAVTSSGAIDAKGGLGATIGGGRGGDVRGSAASGRFSSTGTIDVSAGIAGGGPPPAPASGGSVQLAGVPVAVSGTLTAKGGAADLMAGTGGPGGTVQLLSTGGLITQNTLPMPAGIVVSGGTAQTPGAPGLVVIDGFVVTNQWTR